MVRAIAALLRLTRIEPRSPSTADTTEGTASAHVRDCTIDHGQPDKAEIVAEAWSAEGGAKGSGRARTALEWAGLSILYFPDGFDTRVPGSVLRKGVPYRRPPVHLGGPADCETSAESVRIQCELV